MSLPTITLDDVEAAAEVIAGETTRTPTTLSRTLSEICGCTVFLKFENLQYTASFKERGALNRLSHLSEAERKKGVVAASAGNHAQGVAYHAQRQNIPATIVMPQNTPFTKVRATQRYGANVVLYGEDLSASAAHAREIQAARGLTYIHPYDDPLIIAGQGTVAIEMLADEPDLDMIVVPLGGGGLISGVAIAAKAIRPGIEIVGVEAALYPAMYQVLRGMLPMAGGVTIAEGIAVKEPGEITRDIVRRLVSDVVLVSEQAIEEAVLALLEIEKTVTEGAGAAALAAVMSDKKRFKGKRVGIILSGGNIDSRLLSSILMRGLVRSGRLVRIRVDISDAPGLLARVAQVIGDAGGNIVEVYHQRLFHDVPLKMAELDIVVETRDAEHVDLIIRQLKTRGMVATLLSTMTG